MLRQRHGLFARVGLMDVERISALGRGLVYAGVVLAVGAFALGWSMAQPVVSAVLGFAAAGLGPPLTGLAMTRTADPARRYRLVYLSTLASMATLVAHLYFVVYPAGLDLSRALSTLLYLVLIVAPVLVANFLAIWITYSHRRRTAESSGDGNGQARSGV